MKITKKILIFLILFFLLIVISDAVSANGNSTISEDINDNNTIKVIEINTNKNQLDNIEDNNLEYKTVEKPQANILSQSNQNINSVNKLIKTKIMVSNYTVTLNPGNSQITIKSLSANVLTESNKSVNTGSVYFQIPKMTTFHISVKNGVASHNFNLKTYLSPGKYKCIAFYEDYADHYESCNSTFYFIVKSRTTLNVNNISCKKGESLEIHSNLMTSVGSNMQLRQGKVIFNIDSQRYETPGYLFNFALNKSGLYKCTAKYVGDSYYLNSTDVTFYINVAEETHIDYTLDSKNILANESFNVNYRVIDSIGNTVTKGIVKISESTLLLFNTHYYNKLPSLSTNGYRVVTVSNNTGQYTFGIFYNPKNNNNYQYVDYLTSSEKFNITVYGISSILTNPVKIREGTTTNIKVIVKDHLGQNIDEGEVRTTINFKTYVAKVKNGQAVFKNVKMPSKIGTYNYKIYYSTNTDYYTSSSNNLKITCIHASKITIKSVTGYQGKKVKITATVKDENGNKINKGKIIFKIIGKTYSCIVKNGIAQVTIKYPKAKNLIYNDKKIGSYFYETISYKSIFNCKAIYNEIDMYLGSSAKFKVTSKTKTIVHKYKINTYKTVIVPIVTGNKIFKRGSVQVITKQFDSGTINVLYACAIKNNAFITHHIKVHYKKNGIWNWGKGLKLDKGYYFIFEYGYNIKADKIQIKYYDITYNKIY